MQQVYKCIFIANLVNGRCMLWSRMYKRHKLRADADGVKYRISLLLWATCDLCFCALFLLWVTFSKSCGFGAAWGQATSLTLKERICEHFMLWRQSSPLCLSMHLASESRNHSLRYQRSAENEVELKGTGCTEGLAEIPLNYAVEWAHPHSHISTIQVWAVSSPPEAILTHIPAHLNKLDCRGKVNLFQ